MMAATPYWQVGTLTREWTDGVNGGVDTAVVMRCGRCGALTDDMGVHDTHHEQEELTRQVCDILMAVAVEVFHGDAEALHTRMSPKARDILTCWAALRASAGRGDAP